MEYTKKYMNLSWSFEKVFYSETLNGWFDFNNTTMKHIYIKDQFSMLVPLYTGCYYSLNHEKIEQIFDKMWKNNLFKISERQENLNLFDSLYYLNVEALQNFECERY